jgi:hypothetical protein
MAADELVYRLAILVAVRRFPGMGAADSRPSRSDSYVRMHHFVRRSTSVPFQRFGGMCDVNSCNVFLLLFMALRFPMSATLFRRAVPTLWHAFLFLGLRFFSPLFVFLLGGLQPSTAFSCKKFIIYGRPPHHVQAYSGVVFTVVRLLKVAIMVLYASVVIRLLSLITIMIYYIRFN